MTTGPLEAYVTCRCSSVKYPTKLSFPQSRCKHAVCVHENYLYMVAGKDGNTSLRDFWRYNIGSQKWEAVTFRGDPPHHLEGHTLVSCKKLLLLFGGEFGDALTESSLWIINPDLGYVRRSVPDAGSERPCVRRHHSAVVYSGAMYVYGGYIDIKGSSSEMWKYHADDEEWELLTARQQLRATPGGRHGHTSVVYNKQMWLYGGSTDLMAKQDLWSYSFGVNTWERIKCKFGPPALVGHSAVVVGTRMFVFGGEVSRAPNSQLWYFCFKTYKWTQLMLKDQIPALTFHCAVLVSPSAQHDSAVKANSVPHLQRKIARQTLERPRSSPGVRPESSWSDKHLQKSESQYSLLVEKSVSSGRKRSCSQGGFPSINSSNINKPNVLNLQREKSEDSIKLEPSPSENTADHSPLCPDGTDFNYNAINMLDKNTVNCGIDNPGISDSTEQLILEGYTNKARVTFDSCNDKKRPSPFERSLSYMTEAERCKNLLNGSSETIETFIDTGSCDSLVRRGVNGVDQFCLKKKMLDSELVLEDIEYSDCFPHNIQVPFPSSAGFRFSSFKSAESLLTCPEDFETIVLENYKETRTKPAYTIAQNGRGVESVRYNRNSRNVEFCGLNSKRANSECSVTRIGLDGTCKSFENHSNGTSSNSMASDITETSFGMHSGTQPLVEQDRGHGIYRKNLRNAPKNSHVPEMPYILIVGGDRKSVV